MDDIEEFQDLFEESTMLEASQEPLTTQLSATTTPPVLRRIEAVFERALLAIESGSELDIPLRRRPRVITQHQEDHIPQPISRSYRIRFPGKTAEEAWRFTVTLRILELIYEALRTGSVVSKRDIYYRDPALFGKQAHVDRYIDDIAYTFGVGRSDLNVTAVAKGILAGAASFCRRDGSMLHASTDKEGLLMPNLTEILSVDIKNVKWILVIEKEATFRSIAASAFWNTIQSDGIIVTAKGYPDISSRAMLRFLSTASPRNGFSSPPVFALVDYDPDGLAIMSVYKHGSIALAHESAELRVPQLQWIGLRSEDMLRTVDDVHASHGLLALTPRDRKKAKDMLERDADDGVRSALQQMLMLNNKAELQILSPPAMVELLESTLGRL